MPRHGSSRSVGTDSRKNALRVSGVRVSVGQGPQGERSPQAANSPQELRSALKRFTAWCKEHRHLRLPVLFQRLNAKLRGYYNYYGVHGNAASLQEFFNKAIRILLKWLNRRSQRHSYTWQGYNRSTGALQSCPTTDRWTTQDETGSPQDLSRLAAASITEEPGARKPHAGICAGLRQANMEGASGMKTPPH